MNPLKRFKYYNSTEFEQNFEKTLNEIIVTDNNDMHNCTETIANDYILLIKSLKLKQNPKKIFIDPNDYFVIFIDDKKYDFDFIIKHNNKKLTEAKMEIESLIDDNINFEVIQNILIQQKI